MQESHIQTCWGGSGGRKNKEKTWVRVFTAASQDGMGKAGYACLGLASLSHFDDYGAVPNSLLSGLGVIRAGKSRE